MGGVFVIRDLVSIEARLSADLYPRDIYIFISLYYLVAGYLCTGIALCSLSSCALCSILTTSGLLDSNIPNSASRAAFKLERKAFIPLQTASSSSPFTPTLISSFNDLSCDIFSPP